MTSPVRLAGVAALSAALLLAACSKSHDTSTDSSTTTSAAATEAPAPDATTAPASDATTAAAPGAYIELPVYPGSTEFKDQAMSMSANGTSVVMKVYSSKDDAKLVSDWYKSHLPAAWKNGVLTSDGKTIGTFSNEMPDGDQSIIVATQDDKTTRIQLATKHGK